MDLPNLLPHFAAPWLLVLLLPAALPLLRPERRGGAEFPGFALAAEALRPSRGPLLFRLLVSLGLAALAVAAARPQYGQVIKEHDQSGRDLMLVIDLSGSMRIDDLASPNGRRVDRLEAVIKAARQFVAGRPNDRIGLVFFGDDALTSCPLTYDHDTVDQFLERTERQQRALWSQENGRGDGGGLLGSNTNFGLGLGAALRALREPSQKGRAIILITDGVDSRQLRNWKDPLEAARYAHDKGVRIHGIGVGDPHGTMTNPDPDGRVETVALSGDLLPDMGRLQAITGLADGKAFAANDLAGLTEIFAQVDALEPTPRTIIEHDDFADRFAWPLALGLALVALALALEPRLRGVV